MRVKTFRGDNAKAVLAQIKKELGPEAVILSNQTKRENGTAVCEIMAAVEDAQEKAAHASPDADISGLGAPREPAQDWAREWSEIKKHLTAYLKPHMDLGAIPPRQKLALEHLEREGVEESVLFTLFQALRASPNPSILEELGRLVAIKPFTGPWDQRLQLVVGPHGAGKTTALIRMALAFQRGAKNRRVSLVNADCRGGGRKLLKHYAELSGLTYSEAESPEEFAVLLAQSRNFDRIYVDLPGLTAGETLRHWITERGLSACDTMAAHLVLSPFFAQDQFKAFWKRYQAPCPQSLVWTKLDEACSFGAMINVAVYTGLPASALSYGPGITNSMIAAEPRALWKLVFTRQIPGGAASAVEMAA